jgi:hypothetical protein
MLRPFSIRVSIATAGWLGLTAALGAQATPQGPLAPARYKNIQVLTDVPADRLLAAMNYVAAATGLKCGDCHVTDAAAPEGWWPERDDKRTKQRAREMMKMVKDINSAGFGITVTCATCHQGRSRPGALAVAQRLTPEQASAQRPGGSGASATASPPTVDDVLSKYVEALGGRTAVEHLESRVMSGTAATRDGRIVPVTIEQKGERYRETAGAQSAVVIRGFDGAVAWQNVRGQTLENPVVEQAIRVPDLAIATHIKTLYAVLAADRATRLDGRDVNVLRGSADGVSETLYFDAASGLLVRRAISTMTPLGPLPWQVDYSDYRDVSGLKMPFQITRANWEAIDTLKITDIKPNVQIDDARFARPSQ